MKLILLLCLLQASAMKLSTLTCFLHNCMHLLNLFLHPTVSFETPPPLKMSHLEIPTGKITARVGFDIFSSTFDFDRTKNLTMRFKSVFVWTDKRKAFNATQTKGVDPLIYEYRDPDYIEIRKNMWRPRFPERYRKIYSGKRRTFYEDRITVWSTGKINTETLEEVTLSCKQITDQYPFEKYECYMTWALLRGLKQVSMQLNPPLVRSQYFAKQPTYLGTGHKLIIDAPQIIKNYSTNLDNLNDDELFTGPKTKKDLYLQRFFVVRDQAKPYVLVVYPILCIVIIDFVLSLTDPSNLVSAAIIPIFALHMDRITFVPGVHHFAPITALFFARFFMSVFEKGFAIFVYVLKKKFAPTETDREWIFLDWISPCVPELVQIRIKQVQNHQFFWRAYLSIILTALIIIALCSFSIDANVPAIGNPSEDPDYQLDDSIL